ncbi:MAG: group III truncated hemoglobin [Phaeodactylibacter sp.]|nr:group III truncated hemoglobin [Phaeodactylibacter sp.]
MKKKDIQGREDIKILVNSFYEKLLSDELLSPIFLHVARIDLAGHLPILYDFWESVLFQAGKYRRNTLEAHLELHMKHRLEEAHFRRWLSLFNETVDEHFAGEKAEGAKDRALSIATIIKMKIDDLERKRLEFGN